METPEQILNAIVVELARINANHPAQRVVVEYFGELSQISTMKYGWEKPLPITMRQSHEQTLAELRRLAVVRS